jgi:hypothetical protein
MKINFGTSLILFLTICIGCGANFKNNAIIHGYNLTEPSSRAELPDTLREISGLCAIDSSTFACIQDENGILFFYDAQKNNLFRQQVFAQDGDYEGICRVGNSIFVLRSDGELFEIDDLRKEKFKITTYTTGVVAKNNEGLCYDEDNNRLLIACKGKIGKGPALKDKRQIYAFDLKTKKLDPVPVYDFDLNNIKLFAKQHNLDVPEKHTKKKGDTDLLIRFTTSAIAIHPFTKKLFLLSSSDHMLFIFNSDGSTEHIEVLNPALFNKAEGITFFDNGDMLITNEGQDKKPSLLRFKYQL